MRHLAWLLLVPACGGQAGVDPSPVDAGPVVLTCPEAEPAAGSACRGDLICTYGDTVRSDCRHSYHCTQSAWESSAPCSEPPTGYCTAQPTPGASCTPRSYDGTVGKGAGAACAYADGTLCYCPCYQFNCHPSDAVWACYAPPTTASCPALAPNIGTACTTQGLECTYGDTCDTSGARRFCHQGYWERSVSACPI